MHALLLIAVLASQAVDPVQQADEFFGVGNVAYLKGDYSGAVRAFEEAFRLAPHPALAFSLAQALRRLFFADGDPKNLRRAIEMLRFYLAHDPDGRRRADAVDLLERLEPRLALLDAASTATVAKIEQAPRVTMLTVSTEAPGATASIDGAAPQGIPLFQPVAPGAHRVVIEAPGHRTATRTVHVAEGQNLGLDIPLEEQPAQLKVIAEGAELTIDGRLVGSAPSAPIALQAGLHEIELRRSGHRSFARRLNLAPGEALSIEPELPLTISRRVSHWTFAGSGLLGAIGAGTLGAAIHYENRAASIRDAGLSRSITEAERLTYNESIDRRDDLRIASATLLVTAAVGAITGAILFLLDVD